jgi:prephenate dehydrogenase
MVAADAGDDAAGTPTSLQGPVLVVGAGLLGTSTALALRRRDVDVALQDISHQNLRIASGIGAASVEPHEITPQLVVVAVPPDSLAGEIARALRDTDAVVTDVGSVKGAPLAGARRLTTAEQLTRYVGSHPMAGSERSGPFAASEALFDGRPWAVTPHETSAKDGIVLVTDLARLCGATPVTFTPGEHDEAVARTSHLPHLLAALVAGRLADAPQDHLALSGQGVRDVTRIAAGDAELWQQIISANTDALTRLLVDVRDDVQALLTALAEGDRAAVSAVLDRGVQGTAVIPGKHGTPTPATATVLVAIPDHPGELARLFADAGDIGVNIEDLRIDHDPEREYGLVELSVAADTADHLLGSLQERGWTAHR